ncbi:MAG: hypothetical protein WB290_02555 [Smithella sp.]
MPYCRYCSHDVAYDAKFCPSCGKKNPAEGDESSGGDSDIFLDHLPWDADTIMKFTGWIGGIAGLIFGGALGFNIGGVGGLLIFGVVGAGLGFGVGAVAPVLASIALQGAIVIGVIVFVIWLLFNLWGVGK